MSRPGVLPAPAPPAVSLALLALRQGSGAGAEAVNGKKLGGKAAAKAGSDKPKQKSRRQSAPARAFGLTGEASRAKSLSSSAYLSSVDGKEGLVPRGLATATAGVRKKRMSAVDKKA
jgi:hypothetical protein